MALNNPNVTPEVRKPRARIKANGIEITNWEDIEVLLNPGSYTASTFEVTLPPFGQPQNMGLAWWATQTDVELEIAVGFLGKDGNLGSMRTLIVGLLDHVEADPITGAIVLTGRDYAGALIDSQTTDIYLNLTASDVAAKIAKEHGLQATITKTTTPIGKYFGDGGVAVALTRRESEWDFLTGLAEQEGFRVIIEGKTLYFGPPPTPDLANPYVLRAKIDLANRKLISNCLNFSMRRALTLARDVEVYVVSANRKLGGMVEGHARASNQKRAGRSGPKVAPQVYQFNVPNLSPDQAQKYAEAKLREITHNERVIEATLPGDTAIGQDTVIRVIDTETDFDQVYFLDRIEHRLSFQRGYTLALSAKNHSVYSSYSKG